MENWVGAKFFVEQDPHKITEQVIAKIYEKRQKLGI